MRAVVQRVSRAGVIVEGEAVGRIDKGLLVYLSVDRDDGDEDVAYLADKVQHLRIFNDDAGKLNLDVGDAGGAVLVVSAFTVSADARKGRRPSFDPAAPPETANAFYESFCRTLRASGLRVETGSFRAEMAVESVNDGPICILLESRRLF